ncbi:MAG: ATP-binding protein [Candidatus Hermodarchaeota archaeon]
MLDEKYKKAARSIVKAGVFPFPINDTMIEILKLLINEEELEFIMAFSRKSSQNMEQLKQSSKLSEEQIQKHAKSLAGKGIIFNQPNSEGIMVYRLMPLLMVGVFEYAFMKKLEFNENEKKLAELFTQLFKELSDFIQAHYNTIAPIFDNLPAYDRTIPILDNSVSGKEIEISINEEINVPEEKLIPTQKIEEILKKSDDIAVGHCFCRHHKDLLGNSCKTTELRENCFTLGKSARYCVEQGFARKISREEALKILKDSEKDGLVHKIFHPNSDLAREESSFCNCCKCCCGTLEWWRMGVTALINWTNFLARVDEGLCTGCETCIKKCPVDAINLNNDIKAEINKTRCIGCGICAHFCPEGAISLLEGMRKVYEAVPRLRN